MAVILEVIICARNKCLTSHSFLPPHHSGHIPDCFDKCQHFTGNHKNERGNGSFLWNGRGGTWDVLIYFTRACVMNLVLDVFQGALVNICDPLPTQNGNEDEIWSLARGGG